MARWLSPLWLFLVVVGCAPQGAGPGDVDGGTTAPDSGSLLDAGLEPDAGLPRAEIQASLFWSDAGVVDDPSVVSLATLMAAAADDGHGGALLADWFHRFATTAHSERALPAQFIDEVARVQGPDPTRWDLRRLPFVVTGIHNRVDLAHLAPGGHCGELRVSIASLDPTLQPFHVLFLFRQPLRPQDTVDGRVTCQGTARRWLELSGRSDVDRDLALRGLLAEGLTRERFLLIETVEQSLSPWEWRQWVKVPGPAQGLPFVLDNPPLFQQLDVERLNQPGPLRVDFFAWLSTRLPDAAARRLEFPERFRSPSVRAIAGVPRTVLSLDGLEVSQAPGVRAQLELVGCAACHTADADFVQTRADRGISPFYRKELDARARHLEALARGQGTEAPFGPLQPAPVLP
ncbi:MAG: hypothetical protein SFW67_14585 [Myxococcaceae bacterium]|nr:hypothetical protein [Myxococcaceae bacterium]